jgi:hypothetical protein
MPRNLGAKERVKQPNERLFGAAPSVEIPPSSVPSISWLVRNYQGETAFCGQHAGTHFNAILEYVVSQVVNRFSPRYGAIKMKTPASPVYDGFPVNDGTTLPAIFKWLSTFGSDSFEPLENNVALPCDANPGDYLDPNALTPAMDSDAANHKITDEVEYDALTYQDLCQSIYQNKAVIILIKVDDGFWGTANPTFTQPLYGHFVTAYGYDETGIWVIDSADPSDQFAFKHIAIEYITPTFFFESGTAVDALPVEQEIVSDASEAVHDVAQDTEAPPAQKESLLQEIEEVVEEIETGI